MRRALGAGFLLAMATVWALAPTAAQAAYTPAFTAGTGGTTGVMPIAIRAAELNGDSKADAVVLNLADVGQPGSVCVRLGDGAGGFSNAATVTVGLGPACVVTADFDGDGATDLATANVDDDTLSVRLGTGSGGFTSAPDVALAVGTAPEQLAAGDFDKDGACDLVLAGDGLGGGQIFFLKGNGDGTFGAPAAFGTTILPKSIAVGDFDGNGALDIALADADGGGPADLGSVRVYLGNGDGTFATGGTVVQDSQPRAIVASDVDADGAADLVVANDAGADPLRALGLLGDVSVHLGRGNGLFDQVAQTMAIDHPNAIALADVSYDRVPDLAVVAADHVYVFVGGGNGGFAGTTVLDPGPSSAAVALADLDGDTGADVATADQAPEAISTWVNASPKPLTSSLHTTPASPNGNAGWFVTTPTVGIQRGAAGVTYAARNATVTAASPSSSSDPFTQTVAEGTNTYSWFSVSSADATEPAQSGSVKVDTTDPVSSTNLTSAWASATVDATFTASDAAGGSGLARIDYEIDGGGVQTYAGGSVAISGEGVHTVTRSAVDVAGNAEAMKSSTVNIDLTAPSIEVTGVPAGWQLTGVTIQLNATDGLSGVASRRYRMNGGAVQQTALGNIPVTRDGTNTVECWALDSAGNESAHETVQVRIDTENPKAKLYGFAPGQWYREATVTIEASDTGSGVASVQYGLDGNGPFAYTAPFKVTKEGTTTVEAWAFDGVGHISSIDSHQVLIDATAPQIDATVAASYDLKAVVQLRGDDALSGVTGYEWRLDSGATSTGGPVSVNGPLSVTVTAPGRHTLYALSVDKAGNRSVEKSWTFVVRTKASLGRPVSSAKSFRHGVSYGFTGKLTPKHASTSGLVKVYVQRYSRGAWRTTKIINATLRQGSSYTRYSVSYRVPAAGRYRLFAKHGADTLHVTTYSSSTYLTAK